MPDQTRRREGAVDGRANQVVDGNGSSAPWLARLAFLVALSAIAFLLVAAGLRSLLLVLIGAVGLAVCAAGLWWFVTSRTRVRRTLAAVAACAPLLVLVLYAVSGLLWVVLVTLALSGLAAIAGRAALGHEVVPVGMPEHEVPAPSQPFVIMNPRSGGGKVERFDLERRAEALGADVVLLDVTQAVDVAALARAAVARGADLLGVAGGDGTQALVAGVAAEYDVPLLVISAGTRNHFALDLGLDRTDPSRCLDALTDGVELRIDLGQIADRTFVNNASFGAYAEIVRDPAYRDDKVRTTLQRLPDLLSGRRGARLQVTVDGGTVRARPQAVLISNNAYQTDDIAGLGRRSRLDAGLLGASIVQVADARHAAGLLRRTQAEGLMLATAHQVVVDADAAEIPVGIDGEAVTLASPVHCTIRPQALRVRVPRDRPGAPPSRPALDWGRLRQLALGQRLASEQDVPAALEAQVGTTEWQPVHPRKPPMDEPARKPRH